MCWLMVKVEVAAVEALSVIATFAVPGQLSGRSWFGCWLLAVGLVWFLVVGFCCWLGCWLVFGFWFLAFGCCFWLVVFIIALWLAHPNT